MENYRIDGIINSKTKKIDLDSAHRIGKLVEIDKSGIEKNQSLLMKSLDEEKYIKTSPIMNYFLDNEDIYVETKNRIYKLVKVD